MRADKRYKIFIAILSAVVAIETVFLAYLLTGRHKAAPKMPAAIKGRIAIVIDDWGYSLNNLYILQQIKYPLTAAVLPNLPYSKRIAQELCRRGCEIMLHLPLEPQEKYSLEENTIMASFDEKDIKKILSKALEDTLCAKGVNNHMGSRATEDVRTMTVIFGELKKKRLFFLDSAVTDKSVCPDLAGKMRLAFAQRDVFLDNKEEAEYIKGQIGKLKARAEAYGQAIGIGHDRRLTLEVIKEVMPGIEKEGYRFVFVSDLVR